MCICVWVCAYCTVSTESRRGHQTPGAGFRDIVSCSVWVLVTDLSSSAKAVCILCHWSISLVLNYSSVRERNGLESDCIFLVLQRGCHIPFYLLSYTMFYTNKYFSLSSGTHHMAYLYGAIYGPAVFFDWWLLCVMFLDRSEQHVASHTPEPVQQMWRCAPPIKIRISTFLGGF